MKKLYYPLMALYGAALLSAGCVEKEYSLDNLDESEIRVGDTITTPPVTAHLSFEGLLGGMSEVERILEENNLSIDDLGKVPIDIGNELFLVNLPLDIPLIPDNMLDMFTEAEGATELLMEITSTLPMTVEFRLDFIDAQGAVVTSFEEIAVERAAPGEECEVVQRQDISAILNRISEVKGIHVSLLRPDTEKIAFLLDNYIEVKTRLEKRGGIQLFN